MNSPVPDSSPTTNDGLQPATVQRSKSRLVRLLTTATKRNPRATSPSAPKSPTFPSAQPRAIKRPPAVNSAFGREQREAALRERGLLPPLPQKDLSQLEREQDRKIPVVRPAPDDASIPAGDGMSAADLIKKEWEAKNKDAEAEQRQRLNTFRFGGASSTDLTNLVVSSEGASSSNTSDQQGPKTTPEGKRRAGHQASLSQPVIAGVELSKDHRRSLSLQTKALPAPPSIENLKNPLTPILDLPYGPEVQSYVSNGAVASSENVNNDLPDPSHIRKPSSASIASSSSREGPQPPKPPPKPSSATAPPAATPPPCRPPPPAPTSPECPSIPQRPDSGVLPREDSTSSSTSILTPSLDSASQTISSSESFGVGAGKGKSGGLKLKLENGNPIPVIIESSIENNLSDDAGADKDEGLVAEPAKSTEEDRKEGLDGKALSSSEHGHGGGESSEGGLDVPPPVPPRDPPSVQHQQRKRGMTTDQYLPKSTADQEQSGGAAPARRKTINPFKRNQQQQQHQDTLNPNGNAPKRSFTTISRSVVGSVLRPSRNNNNAAKSDDGNGGNAQEAPSSPRIPSSSSPPSSPKRQYWQRSPAITGGAGVFAQQQQQPPQSPQVVRQAVSPTLYSTATILAEASKIQDEEQRQMAEMMFLS
ncbi:hypothetical protein CC2G_007207 [Coprinopsis cinerea AmutBmut pab1-1]|nr:hypothetical protein CC2G_007207 [Coprinopsis cinerea AmutBmut pab1-1]